MKVLFTHSYFLHLDQKQLRTHTPFPPLATLYAAAVLREKGFEVKLADLQFALAPAEIESHIKNFEPDVLVIYDDAFNYLTKMCLSNMREAAFKMLEIAKSFQIPTIVSSSDATDHIEKYFANGADYVIIGEAEQTLLELVRDLFHDKASSHFQIKGLSFLKNGEVIKTAPRLVLKDLDELPAPAWDLIDIQPYKKMWLRHHGYFSINMVTTRGCPYKCNWCAKPIYGNRYNSHSPQAVVKQIIELQKKFGFTHVWFADDIFGLKPGWIADFNKHVIAEQLHISYKIQSRADLLLDDDNIKDLAESGCDEVWMGAESGSQRILDAMDKGTTIEQINEATVLLKRHGIKPCFFLQFGYLGEQMNDIAQTILMLDELKPHDLGISVSYPLPGTKFFDKVKSDLPSKQNWTDSDDLHLMFQNTYQPQFYRVLQRFVHYKFRTGQSQQAIRQNPFSRSAILNPYYFLRKTLLKKKLIKLEKDAKQLFS
jgi:anaerobic magnesium-protoporphyrin IX monomethyl ester cyclase